MPGFFEALENFKPKERKPYVATIEGQSIAVSFEQHQEILRVGEENYMWQKGEVVRKKRIPAEQQQPTLHKADKGYTFYKKNPFWVNNIDKEGYTWQIK